MLKRIKNVIDNYRTCAVSEQFPIKRMIGKNLAKSEVLPHAELLRKYDEFGFHGFDWKDTSYYRMIVRPNAKLTDSFSALPAALTYMPQWWMMPWASFPGKPRGARGPSELEKRAIKKIGEYLRVYESILKYGYQAKKGGAIKGYFLLHPEYGKIFNYIDGHHRMTILHHLSAKDGHDRTVGVVSLGTVARCELSNGNAFVKGVNCKSFTAEDAYILFDYCFYQLGLSDEDGGGEG